MKAVIQIILLFTTFCISAQKTDSISINNKFVWIEDSNDIFKMSISKDSLSSSFSILRYEFRTKKLQQEYEKKRKEKFEIKRNYSMNYLSFTKPEIIELKHNDSIYSIKEFSKGNYIFKEKFVIFIKKLNCKEYLAFKSYPMEEL